MTLDGIELLLSLSREEMQTALERGEVIARSSSPLDVELHRQLVRMFPAEVDQGNILAATLAVLARVSRK
jgi:hypothetical protein